MFVEIDTRRFDSQLRHLSRHELPKRLEEAVKRAVMVPKDMLGEKPAPKDTGRLRCPR